MTTTRSILNATTTTSVSSHHQEQLQNHHHLHHRIIPTNQDDDDDDEHAAAADEHQHPNLHSTNSHLPIRRILPMETDDNESHASSSSLLTVWQAALLLTADCLGTGLLALPQDIHVLGTHWGMFVLIGLLPINGYAGTLLSRAADTIEYRNNTKQSLEEEDEDHCQPPEKRDTDTTHTSTTSLSYTKVPSINNYHHDNTKEEEEDHNQIMMIMRQPSPLPKDETDDPERIESISSLPTTRNDKVFSKRNNNNNNNNNNKKDQPQYHSLTTSISNSSDDDDDNDDDPDPDIFNNDEAIMISDNNDEMTTTTSSIMMMSTHDYTSITHCIFGDKRHNHPYSFMTTLVVCIYYTNIFLVLGDYILVMAHAVQAFSGWCLPTAGILASTVMLGLSQLRTMNDLGHSVTALSLITLTIVVIQCLVGTTATTTAAAVPNGDDSTSWIRKLSALASIGFATGPNKLILNIRYEMQNRSQAPLTLAMGIGIYGCVYVAICLLAGPSK
jgi:hypothetical protein